MLTKMKMLRGTSFMLAALLSVGLISCSKTDDADIPNTSDSVDTVPDDTSAQDGDRNSISDGLPEKDFGGKTFTIVTFDQLENDYRSDTETGDVINDAIFKRNQTVEERFNVNIETYVPGNYNDTTSYISRVITAGEDAFSLSAHHVVFSGQLAVQDLFVNWSHVPYVDFTKPWWSDSTTNDLTYGKDKVILAVGDLALSSLSGTYCYFFDKADAEDYQIGDLYEVVNNGEWTLDYVEKTIKNVYRDLNNNGEQDGDDYYGMTQTVNSALNAYLWSSGNKVMERGSSGIPQLVLKNERMNTIVDKLYHFVYEADNVCTERNYREGEFWQTMGAYSFRDGLTLMVSGTLDMAVTNFRERKNIYGILPYPKLDENQDDYHTMVDGYHSALAVPKTAEDLEFVGMITEALSAESYKSVFPAYYEIALKAKYSYDDESVQMLDKIVASRVFDFGYVYDGFNGMAFYLEQVIGGKHSRDFESYYAANAPAAEVYYNKVFEFFENLE